MYNANDLKSFGAFIADWQKKGMLEIDRNGNPIVTKGHVENWKLGNSLKFSICPKALDVAQMLTHQCAEIDRKNYTIKNVGRTIELAQSDGVAIVFPWINEHGSIVLNSDCKPSIKKIGEVNDVEALSVREGRSDFPFVHASVPYAQFPVYENGKIVAFGACFHQSDLPIEKTEKC